MKNLALKLTGGALFTLFAGSAYLDLRRRKRDRLARELLREVVRIVNPATTGLLSEDAFDTAYLDKLLQHVGGRIIVMKESAASRVADLIHDAWSFWGDDEDQVNSAFRSLRDKVQVSQVASAYQARHGSNLIDKLEERMDDDEVAEILAIVSALPPYRLLNQ